MALRAASTRLLSNLVPRSARVAVVRRASEVPQPPAAPHLEPKPLEERLDKKQLTIPLEGPVDLTQLSGVPLEHIAPRRVLIKRPTKNAMQSGTAHLHRWTMSFDAQERWENTLMGWCSTADPLSNLEMSFPDKESAIAFCDKNKWSYELQDPPVKPPRAKSYAANFSWNKRTRRSCK